MSFWFHVSPATLRDCILAEGLTPQNPGGWPQGVYLFAEEDNARYFAEARHERELEEGGETSDMDIWMVDTTGLLLHPDPALSDEDSFQAQYPVQPLGSAYVTAAISADCLGLVDAGEQSVA